MMHEKDLPQLEDPIMHKSTESYDASTFFDDIKAFHKGEPLTYGATPLDRMTTLQQQFELLDAFRPLTTHNIPDDIPMEIIGYVHTTLPSRFHSRGEANEDNYVTALYSNSEFSLEEREMFKRGELGQASPSELLLIRQLKGIRSVELACLTHPYGEDRIKMLPEMREVVREHVEFMGGTYEENPENRYRVKEIIGYEKGHEQFDKGVLMTRKRTIGRMPDGTIIRERSSFVLRLDDEMPIMQSEREALGDVDLSAPDWQDNLVKAGKLDEIADVLLEMDEFSYAIPISSTIYAFNPEIARIIKERDEDTTAKKHIAFADEFPEIAAVMQLKPSANHITRNENNMLFVGPPPKGNYELADAFFKAMGIVQEEDEFNG